MPTSPIEDSARARAPARVAAGAAPAIAFEVVKHLNVLAVSVFSLTLAASARANVKLPAIFGDHMVIQRGVKVPVWGTAMPDEVVSVKAAGQEQTAKADASGKWRAELTPIESKEAIEITVTGKNSIVLHDVLVGEVWLCAGQSNMVFSLARASNAEEALKGADRPTMRLFKAGRAIKDEPQTELAGGEWVVCSPKTVGGYTAVGYFMGAELQDKLHVPVGLIESDWGGTRAEAWIPRATFDALKLPYEPNWTEQWLKPIQTPNAKKPEPARPHEAPAVLYNGMIAPFAGYAMRGAVWYQGETNTAYPADYERVLGALVTSWRAAWKQGDFPFLVVQLPNFIGRGRDWATLRASQAKVAKDLPNVGLAVTIDLGNPDNIHPTNKQPVGHRLALIAQKMAYGQDVACSGPTFKSLEVNGNEAVVTFGHVDDGLVARGGAVLGFELAGEDGKFVPATGKIKGPTVILQADGVSSPRAVRCAWANDPKCTLYNAIDLPAAPFSATTASSR
jgi:sialate O-acetylesterase